MERMPGKNKMGLLVGLGFLLVGALAGLFWSYTRPENRAIEQTTLPYIYESAVDYRVYLLPNDLYTETYLGPGRAYLSALSDYLEAEFTFHFTAEEEAELKGEYSVTALITAQGGSDNLPVWEKSFPLLLPQTFQISGNEVLVQESVVVPYSQYADLAKKIVEETKFSPQNLDLEVVCNITVETDTPEGPLRESAAPSLTIPLRDTVFTVERRLGKKENGEVAVTRWEPTPYYKEARWGFALLSILSGCSLLLFLQLTSAAGDPDMAQKELSRILKQNSDRIVRLAEKISLTEHNVLTVASFEDLLKIADELELPVFYQNGEHENNRGHAFIIFSGQYTYFYYLTGAKQRGNKAPQKRLPRRAAR
ncbi:MAG: DUF5305 domain-containing protein [Firmicutes bacterium]|nr:DUF5305 domain-containing protein [Bacillota bacterium]